MSENLAIEKLLAALKIEQKEIKPNSCGCGKCSVEITFLSLKFTTHSLNVVAGVHLAKRSYLDFNRTALLLWTQDCQPGLSDKVQAIYDFCDCSRILEYAEKFDGWKDAVKTVRQSLVKAAEKKITEITVKVVDPNRYERVIKVNPYDDVRKLKYRADYDKLTFRQQTLLNGTTFASYGIIDGSEIYMN